jgi:hypothetical protein
MEKLKPQLSDLQAQHLVDSLWPIIKAIEKGTGEGIFIAGYEYPMAEILEALLDIERERGICIYEERVNVWLRKTFGENDWPYHQSYPGPVDAAAAFLLAILEEIGGES